MKEEWRDIPGLVGRYQVSSFGRVRGVGPRAQGVKTPYVTRIGYHSYALYTGASKTKKTTTYYGHALVAAAFIGPRPSGMVACHNDGNGSNNVLTNIRYDTPAENSADMVRHGHSLQGTKQKRAKLTDGLVREIRSLKGLLTYREIASDFGVSFSTIQKVMSGEGWRHVRPLAMGAEAG